jgi:hypothetical protein
VSRLPDPVDVTFEWIFQRAVARLGRVPAAHGVPYGSVPRIEKKRPRRGGAFTFQIYRGAGGGGGTTTAGPPTVPLLSQILVVLIAPSASVRDV